MTAKQLKFFPLIKWLDLIQLPSFHGRQEIIVSPQTPQIAEVNIFPLASGEAFLLIICRGISYRGLERTVELVEVSKHGNSEWMMLSIRQVLLENSKTC